MEFSFKDYARRRDGIVERPEDDLPHQNELLDKLLGFWGGKDFRQNLGSEVSKVGKEAGGLNTGLAGLGGDFMGALNRALHNLRGTVQGWGKPQQAGTPQGGTPQGGQAGEQPQNPPQGQPTVHIKGVLDSLDEFDYKQLQQIAQAATNLANQRKPDTKEQVRARRSYSPGPEIQGPTQPPDAQGKYNIEHYYRR